MGLGPECFVRLALAAIQHHQVAGLVERLLWLASGRPRVPSTLACLLPLLSPHRRGRAVLAAWSLTIAHLGLLWWLAVFTATGLRGIPGLVPAVSA